MIVQHTPRCSGRQQHSYVDERDGSVGWVSAVGVYSVRDQLVVREDGQVVGEQLSHRSEGGETKCGGGGCEYEPDDQLCVNFSSGRGVSDGHDVLEQVECVDYIERADAHHPYRKKVGKVGDAERRDSRLEVEPGRRDNLAALTVGDYRGGVEFLAAFLGGFGLRRHHGEAHSDGCDAEPGRLGDCLRREVHGVDGIQSSRDQ